MDNTEYLWLVEIRIKDWCKDLPNGSRTFDYIEVLARKGYYQGNEFARYKAMEEVARRLKYEPVYKRKLNNAGLEEKDLCAPDAVIIEEN